MKSFGIITTAIGVVALALSTVWTVVSRFEHSHPVAVNDNKVSSKTPGDLNRLFDLLQAGGYSNTIIRVEKKGYIYEVKLEGRTNAAVFFVGMVEE